MSDIKNEITELLQLLRKMNEQQLVGVLTITEGAKLLQKEKR